jgi:hypothetical protein
MTNIENVIETPAANELWRFEGGVWWMKRGEHDGAESVRQVANAMNALGARFITITAYQLPCAEGFKLEYHWDLEGRLLGFTFNIVGNAAESAKVESIYDLCEAADWIEREVHEGFGIDFTGREYEPLLLRECVATPIGAPASRPVVAPASTLATPAGEEAK